MLCPRCETPALDERERDGVTVDVCRSCRGVWLDRGELEKLMTADPPGEARRREPDDRHRDDDRRPYRKRSSLGELLGELFD